MIIFKAFIFAIAFFSTSIASAELMFNTAKLKPSGGVSVYFVASEVGYENGSDFDIERKTIGGDYSIPVSREMDFVLQAGLIFDAEVDGGSDDGQGFQLGGGGRMLLHSTSEVKLLGFGLINYLNESYDSPSDPSLSTIDIHLGATALFPISPDVQPYAGLELALFSDGDFEAGSAEVDIERDDLIMINLGVVVPLSRSDVFVEMTIGGEQTVTIGSSF